VGLDSDFITRNDKNPLAGLQSLDKNTFLGDEVSGPIKWQRVIGIQTMRRCPRGFVYVVEG